SSTSRRSTAGIASRSAAAKRSPPSRRADAASPLVSSSRVDEAASRSARCAAHGQVRPPQFAEDEAPQGADEEEAPRGEEARHAEEVGPGRRAEARFEEEAGVDAVAEALVAGDLITPRRSAPSGTARSRAVSAAARGRPRRRARGPLRPAPRRRA